jgi:hypothetical protein
LLQDLQFCMLCCQEISKGCSAYLYICLCHCLYIYTYMLSYHQWVKDWKGPNRLKRLAIPCLGTVKAAV